MQICEPTVKRHVPPGHGLHQVLQALRASIHTLEVRIRLILHLCREAAHGCSEHGACLSLRPFQGFLGLGSDAGQAVLILLGHSAGLCQEAEQQLQDAGWQSLRLAGPELVLQVPQQRLQQQLNRVK